MKYETVNLGTFHQELKFDVKTQVLFVCVLLLVSGIVLHSIQVLVFRYLQTCWLNMGCAYLRVLSVGDYLLLNS